MIDKKLIDYVKNYIENGSSNIINTGFTDLDVMLKGVDKGSIITIGGRPAMGKTTLMLGILHNMLKNNKKCLYFSLDTYSEQFIIKQLLPQVCEIGIFKICQPEYIETHLKEKINSALEEIEKYNLFLEDGCLNIQQIREKIEKFKPEFVFINYVQLINISNKKQRNNAMAEMLYELKSIAKENNLVIFMTSQLSRAVESRTEKRPLLSDLRDSGEIEIISDVVMFIYRATYYHLFEKDYEFWEDDDYASNKYETEIIIAKNKTGPCGTVKLLFRNEIPKFLNPVREDVF